MTLHEWALTWNIPYAALQDLKQRYGLEGNAVIPAHSATTETGVQNMLRMRIAQKGGRLWRNNVGALQDTTGRHVRYGLANDSATVNKRIKSADLIGIQPITITPAMVGHVIGQFISREVKAPGWRYTGTEREQAQLRWIELVASLGGDAQFTTGV